MLKPSVIDFKNELNPSITNFLESPLVLKKPFTLSVVYHPDYPVDQGATGRIISTYSPNTPNGDPSEGRFYINRTASGISLEVSSGGQGFFEQILVNDDSKSYAFIFRMDTSGNVKITTSHQDKQSIQRAYPNWSTTNGLAVGAVVEGVRSVPFKGALHEARVWDRALTDEECEMWYLSCAYKWGYTPRFKPEVTNPDIYLDPFDISTMFQDEDGLIPVTASGQTVSLWKNKGTLGDLGDFKINSSTPMTYTVSPEGVPSLFGGTLFNHHFSPPAPDFSFMISRANTVQGWLAGFVSSSTSSRFGYESRTGGTTGVFNGTGFMSGTVNEFIGSSRWTSINRFDRMQYPALISSDVNSAMDVSSHVFTVGGLTPTAARVGYVFAWSRAITDDERLNMFNYIGDKVDV